MFDLKRDRGNPVYLQIQAQLERRIAAGTLGAGDSLPSVRALARQLRINPNTVARAYRELEFRGLVVTRHGEGTFVADDAGKQTQADALISRRADQLVDEAKQMGLNKRETLDAVDRAWRKRGKTGQRGATG